MRKKPLPELPDTGRRYVEQTLRARLAGPGIERYAPRRRRGAQAAIGLAVVAAIVAAALLLL